MSEEWYIAPTGADKLGPMGEEKVRELIREGKVWPVSLCWRYGYSDWRRIGEVYEFRGLFAQGLPIVPVETAEPMTAEPRPGVALGPALERGAEAARRALNRSRKAVVRTVRATDLALKIRMRRGGLRKLYAALGEGVWLCGKDFLDSAEFQAVAERIKTASAEISDLERELAEVKAQRSETSE